MRENERQLAGYGDLILEIGIFKNRPISDFGAYEYSL
jgi:hypothetical protein